MHRREQQTRQRVLEKGSRGGRGGIERSRARSGLVSSFLCFALLLLACERGEAPASNSGVSSPPPAPQASEAPSGEVRSRVTSFEQGSLAQQELMLSVMTHTLDGKQAPRLNALMELFYSEPVSAPQLRAGYGLLEALEELGRVEEARQVARDLRALPLPELYETASLIRLAEFHARLADALEATKAREESLDQARSLYEEVLERDADYLPAYLWLIGSAEEEKGGVSREEWEARYLKRRASMLDDIEASKVSAGRRRAIIERLAMVEDEPDGRVEALFERALIGEAQTSSRELMEGWLSQERGRKRSADEQLQE